MFTIPEEPFRCLKKLQYENDEMADQILKHRTKLFLELDLVWCVI